MFLINTFLGFIIAQLYDILSRNRYSSASPQKFNRGFFIRDTWLKMLFSILLSFAIALVVHLNWDDVSQLAGRDWILNNLVFVLIGAAPEFVLQRLKKKYGFLQPDEVDNYKRK